MGPHEKRRPEHLTVPHEVRERPAVTIGIPNYGRPDGLRRCLESLSAQTFRDFEIIVSDDASPDPAVSLVIEEFARRDPRVRAVVHPANLGMFRNFRFVLDEARGEFFLWSSNDDHWAPDFLERTMAAVRPGIGAVSGGVIHFNDQGVSGRRFDLSRFACEGPDAGVFEAFVEEPEILGKSHLLYALFRTRTLREAADAVSFGAHDRWSEDVIVSAAVLARSGHVACPEALLYKHRRGRKLDFLPGRFVADAGFPFRGYADYRSGLLAAAADEAGRSAVERIMLRRLIFKLAVSSWRKPLARLLGKLLPPRSRAA